MRPLAFRIFDFKSIDDTGVCTLSEDRITVLAGQNESGKTSILTALKDFDLNEGKQTDAKDYIPDKNSEKRKPRVAVKFSITPEDLESILEEDKDIPAAAKEKIITDGHIWVFRYFSSGKFNLYSEMTKLFNVQSSDQQSQDSKERKMLSYSEFAAEVRRRAPYFTYFDTFKDELVRDISIQEIVTASSDARTAAYNKLPTTVRDFLTLAEIDIDYLATISDDDRLLGNYLNDKAANITGHFLNYWKQKTNSEETVKLRAHHKRSRGGDLLLSFYVNDGTDQYPDQRSRGFLWFLSFFLRLTSSSLLNESTPSLILIDEPGTYLHSKAQLDVLSLLEKWIVKDHWVIYSTHSPYLIQADKLHRVRIVGKQRNKGTFIADRLTDTRLKGNTFSDALSPVLTAIGIDLSKNFDLVKKKNLITEGITDFYYLHAWDKLLELNTFEKVSIFPGTSASSVPTLASLLIGWGVHFCVLVDRDEPGKGAAGKLVNEMDIPRSRVLQVQNGIAIEDLFSIDDFQKIIKTYDDKALLDTSILPSKALAKSSVNKVLFARHFSEMVTANKLLFSDISDETKGKVRALFLQITEVLKIPDQIEVKSDLLPSGIAGDKENE